MEKINFQCSKCSNHSYNIGEIRAAGSFLAKIFDVQNEKFSYVSCSKCSYTEFYKADSNQLGNIFDFFTG